MMFHPLALVLLTVTVVAVVTALFMYRKAASVRLSNQNLRAVVDSQTDYTFLIDSNFDVKETNCNMHGHQSKREPQVLGNMLHCRNAHESGRCGSSESCKSCPVRFVISKSMERKSDFDSLEACMELNGTGGKVMDVDVRVDGRYVQLNHEDRMVVNVRNITNEVGVSSPKVLFISENAQLYDRIRRALKGQFRVLSADNLHQALHRLLLAADYNFYAVLTDDVFYSQNDTITKILVKDNRIPVFVFTSNVIETKVESNVSLLDIDVEPQELLMRLLEPQHEHEPKTKVTT